MPSPVNKLTEGSTQRGYLVFLVGTHFMIHVYTMLLPVLLLPLQEELGISLVQLSLLASIPRLLNVLIYIPTGLISDKYPSAVLAGSFLAATLGAVIIPLSRTFSFLLLGFTFLSIGSTLYHPPSLRMASEYDPKKVSFAMGIHNLGSSLGFSAGPLLLGVMMNDWGWRYSFYIWAALSLVTAVISYRFTQQSFQSYETETKQINVIRDIKTILTKNFILVVAMSTLVEAVFMILVLFVPLYFINEMNISYSLTSIIIGLGPLTGLLGSMIGGFSGVRYGKYRMGIIVLVIVGSLLALFPLMTNFYIIVTIYGLTRCLQAAYMPLLNSMLAGHSDPNNRSLSFSFNFVMVNLIGSIATTGTSYLVEAWGTSVIFPISIGITIPTILVVFMLRNSKEKM